MLWLVDLCRNLVVRSTHPYNTSTQAFSRQWPVMEAVSHHIHTSLHASSSLTTTDSHTSCCLLQASSVSIRKQSWSSNYGEVPWLDSDVCTKSKPRFSSMPRWTPSKDVLKVDAQLLKTFPDGAELEPSRSDAAAAAAAFMLNILLSFSKHLWCSVMMVYIYLYLWFNAVIYTSSLIWL